MSAILPGSGTTGHVLPPGWGLVGGIELSDSGPRGQYTVTAAHSDGRIVRGVSSVSLADSVANLARNCRSQSAH